MRNVRFRNFQSGVCVSVKTSRVLSSIHAVANQRHTTTKLKEVRRGPRASQKGKTANPFPVFLFIYLFFFFLTRFFKLSSSVSALTERVTACAIQSIHIIGFFRLFLRLCFTFILFPCISFSPFHPRSCLLLSLFFCSFLRLAPTA